jgi:hypothetical protein
LKNLEKNKTESVSMEESTLHDFKACEKFMS